MLISNVDKSVIVINSLETRLSRNDLACVAWRFWLGALSNKVGRGQRNREEIGAEATCFYFSRGFDARSRALRARISRLRRSSARLNKTAMLRRLGMILKSFNKLAGRVLSGQ